MLEFLFGWGRKIRKLRKRWDRLREKSLKKDEPLKSTLLTRLDQIEQNLRMLEERRLTRIERARLAKEIEIDLAGIKELTKAEPEEFAKQQRAQYPQSQQQRKQGGNV
jgi:hypothetical protein